MIINGQVPDEHYWLYLTSVKGEFYLDFSLCPFNIQTFVVTKGYPALPPRTLAHFRKSPSLWSQRKIREFFTTTGL